MSTFETEPTLVLDVTGEMKVMQEEIFGPILPIVTYESTTSGNVLINDTILHYAQDDIPFGGIAVLRITSWVSLSFTVGDEVLDMTASMVLRRPDAGASTAQSPAQRPGEGDDGRRCVIS